MRPFLFLLLALPVLALAQPKAEWFEHPGSIQLPDGSTKPGIIRVYGHEQAPWLFQSAIRFMDSTAWMALDKARKKDFTEYAPKELLGYRLHDLQLAFVSKPFADMSSVSIKMVKQQYFMHGIALGKVNLYHYYDAPPKVYVGAEGEYEKLKEESAMNNYVLLEKETGKLKNITDVDLRELIGDCPAVVAKYEAGDYGPSPMDGGKKKGLGKFVSKVVDSNRMKQYAEPLFRDYNDCVK